jgi:hypothetical protein
MHGEVAAALSLAIVLTLAGMLGQVGLGALSKQNASLRRVSRNRCAVYLHFSRTVVPPNRPANAAVKASDCAEFFMKVAFLRVEPFPDEEWGKSNTE